MKRNWKNNVIEKGEYGYIVKTQKQYSSIVTFGNFIVAYSEERKELILYDDEFIMIKKITGVESVKDYSYKTVVFLVIVKSYATYLLIIQNNKYEVIRLKNEYGDAINFQNLYAIEENKYLVIGYYRPYIEGYGRGDTEYVFAMINLNEKATLFEVIAKSVTYSIFSKRFLVCRYKLYDLYTMKEIEWPKESKMEKILDIEVHYSSKQILVVKISNQYYLYINGKIIYVYSEEEHEQVLSDLRNYCTISKEFCTVIIKNKICIWSKNTIPQVIKIPR